MPASAVLRARQGWAQTLERLIRVIHAPQFPDVGADMLVTRESDWQRGARTARTPAFGVAVITYLVAAWVVSAATSPRSTEGPTPGGTGITPPTGLTTVPGSSSGSGLTDASDGPASADVRVDPQYFANLQKVLGDLDGQASQDRPRDQHYGFGGQSLGPAPGPAEPVDGQPPDAPAPDTAPDPQSSSPTTALPNRQQPPPSDAPAPATAPGPPTAGSPDGQPPVH